MGQAMDRTDLPSGLSYPEFLDWLDEDVQAEWVGGEIIIISPASRLHQRLAGFLTAVLKLHVEPQGLGEVIPAPFQMRCAPHLAGREPDLLFVAQVRTGIITTTFVDGPADLVVEIVSPESRRRDTVEKFAEYQEGDVREYWLIDPPQDALRMLRLRDGKYAEVAPQGSSFASAAVEGFVLDVAAVRASFRALS